MSTLPKKQSSHNHGISLRQRSQSLEDLTYDPLIHGDESSGFNTNKYYSTDQLTSDTVINISDDLPPPKPPRRDIVFIVHYTVTRPHSLGIKLGVGHLDRNLWGRQVKGLGYSFGRKPTGICICVADIRPGSVADDGRLKKGDEILSINGHAMETVSLETAR